MSRKPPKGRPPARRQAQPQQQNGQTAQQRNPGVIEYRSESYSGPFPPAAEIERLQELDPRAPRIIFDNFDEQGRNRRDLEQQVVKGSERRADRGQLLLAIIFLSAIIAGFVIAMTQSAAAGASVIAAVVGSGALLYIVGGRPPSP